MSILVISDVHLGIPNRLPEADGSLCSLLLSTTWDKVIFLGDLFDLWNAPFADITKKHPTVVESINALKCEVIYLPGNHDGILSGLKKINNMVVAASPYLITIRNQTISLVHGDAYDDFEGTPSKIASWLGNSIDRMVQKIAGPGVSIQRTVRRSFASMGTARSKYTEPIAKAAVEDLKTDVVMGHTHVPEELFISGHRYVNCGDFGPEHMSYVTIDSNSVDIHIL